MARYLGDMQEPVIESSARKHGVADEDMLHCYRNVILTHGPDNAGCLMLIGPRRDGGLIEVGVVSGDQGTRIIHAMDPARDKFLPRR